MSEWAKAMEVAAQAARKHGASEELVDLLWELRGDDYRSECLAAIESDDAELDAAALLREQENELTMLRAAVAAKEHIVTVEIADKDYRKEFSANFIIADPRIYRGEMTVDAFMVERAEPDWLLHIAHQLTRVATDQWLKDLTEKAAVAFFGALKAQTIRAETGSEADGFGAQHESAVAESDAPRFRFRFPTSHRSATNRTWTSDTNPRTSANASR